MLRLVLVEDEPIFRRGLRWLVKKQGWTVAAEAVTADEALTAIRETRPDVAVVDLGIPGSGFHVLKAMPAGVRSVVCTHASGAEPAIEATRAGAHGFVDKGEPEQTIIYAITLVARGERYIPEELRAAVEHGLRPLPLPRHEGDDALLTDRQREVFVLLGDVLQNKQIADRLGIDERTVEAHRAAIARRLSVAPGDLVARAVIARVNRQTAVDVLSQMTAPKRGNRP